MHFAIVMPQLGLTMEEGMVSGWFKKTGEAIKRAERLFSVTTDKVDMEVESPVDGMLGEIIVQTGETVKVGAILAYVEYKDQSVAITGTEQSLATVEQIPNCPRESTEPAPPERKPEKNSGDRNRRHQQVSPRAKRAAKELHVDLAAVSGTGSCGEVTEKDVRAASTQVTRLAGSPITRRQLIAERLTHSIQSIPTFSVGAEVNVENFMALHECVKELLKRTTGRKSTLTDLLLAAFARTFKENSELNAVWEEGDLRNCSTVDLGLAVATTRGVIAPVIRNLESMGIHALVPRRIELVERARSGRIALADLQGGVATLSNLGMYRVDHFQAVISPGQSSILAVGRIHKRPWVDGVLTIKPTMILNLIVDHRVADGAAGSAFLGKLVELIEDPKWYFASLDSADSAGEVRRSNA